MGYPVVGANFINDAVLRGSTWYVGLILATPSLASGDTMGSHAGWTESSDYAEAARPTLAPPVSSGGATACPPLTFTMNNSVRIAGYFITSVSTKGGTTGTLLVTKLFAEGEKNLITGQPLVITPSQVVQDLTV